MSEDISLSLETVTKWARKNLEWDKVYRYIFLHPNDFFVILPERRWPIAHQVVYHGNVDLLKRILALFSDGQIDIHYKSGDNKTLLDVAIEKRHAHPLMYTYIERLFAQDELMEEAKKSNWRSVTEILEKNKELADEKPPYSPCFLLHYVVQNGDAEILQNLLDHYRFQTNVLNINDETPLHMAIRLNKHDICSILRPQTVAQPSFIQNQSQKPPAEHLHRSDERVTHHSPINPPNQTAQHQPSVPMPALSEKLVNSKTQSPYIGFGGITVDIGKNGDFTVELSTIFNSALNALVYLPPLPQQQQLQPISPSRIEHVHTRKSIISDYPLTDLDPLPPQPTTTTTTTSTSSNNQLTKNLTCALTKQIFVDPVIATDGQTYERTAILQWVNTNHFSPATGESMDATFRDNTDIKEMIQSIRKQS